MQSTRTLSVSSEESNNFSVKEEVDFTLLGTKFWTPSPYFGGWILKRGFKWRKRFKLRYFEFNGTSMRYLSRNSQAPDAVLGSVDIETTAFIVPKTSSNIITIYPSKNAAMPWVLKAEDSKTQARWIKRFNIVLDYVKFIARYEIGAELGSGGYGSVYELRDTLDYRNNQTARLAVKVIDASHIKMIKNEIRVLKKIMTEIVPMNPHIMKMHGVYEYRNKIYLIMNRCLGGELYHRIVTTRHLSENASKRIMSELMNALVSLHDINIAHLDVKAENILFTSKDSQSSIQLVDFGLAKVLIGKKNQTDVPLGTIGYMAPEVITSRCYSTSADVFSSGVLLYILLVGYPPFNASSSADICKKTIAGDYSFSRKEWKYISSSAKNLIRQMLDTNPRTRITSKQVLEHEWMKKSTTT